MNVMRLAMFIVVFNLAAIWGAAAILGADWAGWVGIVAAVLFFATVSAPRPPADLS